MCPRGGSVGTRLRGELTGWRLKRAEKEAVSTRFSDAFWFLDQVLDWFIFNHLNLLSWDLQNCRCGQERPGRAIRPLPSSVSTLRSGRIRVVRFPTSLSFPRASGLGNLTNIGDFPYSAKCSFQKLPLTKFTRGEIKTKACLLFNHIVVLQPQFQYKICKTL